MTVRATRFRTAASIPFVIDVWFYVSEIHRNGCAVNYGIIIITNAEWARDDNDCVLFYNFIGVEFHVSASIMTWLRRRVRRRIRYVYSCRYSFVLGRDTMVFDTCRGRDFGHGFHSTFVRRVNNTYKIILRYHSKKEKKKLFLLLHCLK